MRNRRLNPHRGSRSDLLVLLTVAARPRATTVDSINGLLLQPTESRLALGCSSRRLRARRPHHRRRPALTVSPNDSDWRAPERTPTPMHTHTRAPSQRRHLLSSIICFSHWNLVSCDFGLEQFKLLSLARVPTYAGLCNRPIEKISRQCARAQCKTASSHRTTVIRLK